jgi:hypothetical protein
MAVACDENAFGRQPVHQGQTLLAEFADRDLLHN